MKKRSWELDAFGRVLGGTTMTAPALDGPRFLVRPIEESEMPLVLSSWLRTLHADVRKGHSELRKLSREAFFAGERSRAEKLLMAHGASAAVLPEVPDEVLGWACYQTEPVNVLHYCYVKRDFRGAGVMRTILGLAFILDGAFEVSTMTADVKAWIAKGRPVVYNPYAGTR